MLNAFLQYDDFLFTYADYAYKLLGNASKR